MEASGNANSMLYAVEFTSINSQPLGTGAGSRWDDALAKCATKIVKQANRAAHQVRHD